MSAPVALPPPPGVEAASAYPPVTRRRAALAVAGAVLAYLVVLGPYVVTAVLVLLGRAHAPHTVRGAGTGLLEAAGLLVVGLLLAWGSTALLGRATVRDWWRGRRSGLRGGVVVPAAWVVGALAVGMTTYTVVLVTLVVGFHGRPPTPTDPLSGVEWVDLLRGLLAGPQEELVVVALPLVVAARLGGSRLRPGRPPLWLWAVLVAARLAYHVYYGPEVLELLPWAVVVPWLFWRTRQIWPIVLAHSVYDVSLMLAAYADRLLPLVVLPLLLVATVGTAAVVRARVPRERRWSLRRVAPAGRGVVPQDLRPQPRGQG